ncbi:FAD-dependent oxidoreductase [Sulfitobacter mediterraneus]|uniref:GcvT family protein n=1 Tax=Sulfitobacter mediterraneus TaxID=83219 RepID=UPI001931293B|nr:FAD-dependent oxidoreductase [Sulfitobacter mediterraneus]MBM1633556.1 FAD-dependent oxidoreductase [Sulfitobacter mediterraneus]MBM1641929.1 FAD-dependent oxidoreductase [Sulfitobacter mediterraneus]MBM1645420.1 FAD-dependent oxidoreductase [Sulfitobacter mediterraneus]MBM1650048.1 FAD-dependent oxidoreductase [Sulfitobacter mediterraneus]MBM1653489.1 FAD-dependent oxidoreductase [Sulfitobacter mediterraneus]
MKSRTKVVVIGGGIAGCSTLYHLTEEGWSDVVLIERDELTSGTTWHSAAQVTNFGMNQTMVGLKSHSISLYKKLRDDPEYPVGYHHGDGGIRLANTEAQMQAYRHFASMARGMDVTFEVIDAAECARRHPLISTDNLLGGLWDGEDGDIDPAQLCQALAFHARKAGAEVYRHTNVTALTQHTDDTWTVETDKGSIDADIVVNACGYRVNEVGKMMGVHHPVASMEHQYFVTEDIPAIVEAGHRMPLLRCPISDYYSRQEKNGLLVGFYEQDCKTWGMDGISPSFANDLCPDDLDRVMDVLEGAFERMPALTEVGIKRVVNGPITYTIDGAPLVGPIPGKRNAFCIIGLRAGVGEGGGHGWLLAQQIVHGEAQYDTWCIDPRRFTGHTNVELTALKAIEDYQNEFRFHFPHEHRPAGRNAKTTPLTPIMAAEGAEFTVVNGWERVDYVKPSPDFHPSLSFNFDETFDIVGAEVRNVQENVGLCEVNGFNRFEIAGADRHSFLDRMFCGAVTKKDGRVGLGYLLNHHGMIKGEATIANIPASDRGPARCWYGSAAASEYHDMDWLTQHLRSDEDVQIRSMTNDQTILVLAGPKARDVLSDCARGDWSKEAFPWLSVRECFIGFSPATVLGVSFSGELAYEIHVPNASLYVVYLALREAGKAHGMKLFGARAVESMRLEKGFLHWKADLLTEFDPFETGLDRFVRPDKGAFIGQDALRERMRNGPTRRLVTLKVNSTTAPAHGGASLMQGDAVVGTVTSGEWGHRVGTNLAYAFVLPELAAVGTALQLDLCGELVAAEVISPSPYDPEYSRMRA